MANNTDGDVPVTGSISLSKTYLQKSGGAAQLGMGQGMSMGSHVSTPHGYMGQPASQHSKPHVRRVGSGHEHEDKLRAALVPPHVPPLAAPGSRLTGLKVDFVAGHILAVVRRRSAAGQRAWNVDARVDVLLAFLLSIVLEGAGAAACTWQGERSV
eukprot:scaffold1686_cov371-Prasinococcus_capsulatus_cf.AAC.5